MTLLEEVLKKKLNQRQYKAATTINGPLLIIAGAGSGKTRVITYRIAYMLSNKIEQKEILALTFTNKAATEVKERVKKLLSKPLCNLTVSTFHAFGLSLLKENCKRLGYKKNFSIYDGSDKLSFLKELLVEEGMLNNNLSLNAIANSISSYKNELMQKEDFKTEEARIFELYEERLKIYNAFDFDDLIFKSKILLQNSSDLRELYDKRYKYILIDEFQDTSLIQYELIRLLVTHDNLCCVGDDDQSIYSWRGANYLNIFQFEKDYKVKEIKLEQNYRSTKNILNAANCVIANNQNRKEKSLWSAGIKNNLIQVVSLPDELLEAEFIVKQLIEISKSIDFKNKNIGILFRTNALFRNMEMALRKEGIRYKVSGGTSFFQRKEIKDIISYLNIIMNPKSDYDLLRVINIPRRGIGKECLKKIRGIAEKKRCSLYDSLRDIVFSFGSNIENEKILGKNTMVSIEDFVSFVEEYQYKIISKTDNYSSIIKDLIESVEYWGHLVNEHSNSLKSAKYKYQNVENFITMIKNWEAKRVLADSEINTFLNYVVLQTNEENQSEKDININLMTIHAAKGLEFDEVFLCGVEDNIIPHQKSIEESAENIEEERRIFYVALTRAKENLTITMSMKRKKDKQIFDQNLSRFMSEIPEELLNIHFNNDN